MRAPPRTEPERAREEIRLEHGLQHDFQRSLHNAVTHGRNRQRPLFLAAGLWYEHPACRKRPVTAVPHLRGQLIKEPGNPIFLDIRKSGGVNARGAIILRTAAHARHRTSLRRTLSHSA